MHKIHFKIVSYFALISFILFVPFSMVHSTYKTDQFNALAIKPTDKLPKEIIFFYSVESPWGSQYLQYSIKLTGSEFKLFLNSREKKKGLDLIEPLDTLSSIILYKNSDTDYTKDVYPKFICNISKSSIFSLINKLNNIRSRPVTFENLEYGKEAIQDSADKFIKRNSKKYMTEDEKKYIYAKITEMPLLNDKLQEYYVDPEEKNTDDGYTQNFSITLLFNSYKKIYSSKSHKAFLIPWLYNGKYFNDIEISIILSNILDKTEIYDEYQWKGIDLYNHIAECIIADKINTILNLAAHQYDSEIHKLQQYFHVFNARLMKDTGTINREANEIWLSCILKDSLRSENIVIYYSNTIDSNKLKYSLQPVISNGKRLISKILGIDQISSFLKDNRSRKVAIHFDDEGKLPENLKSKFTPSSHNYDDSYLVALYDESGKISYVLITANNEIIKSSF